MWSVSKGQQVWPSSTRNFCKNRTICSSNTKSAPQAPPNIRTADRSPSPKPPLAIPFVFKERRARKPSKNQCPLPRATLFKETGERTKGYSPNRPVKFQGAAQAEMSPEATFSCKSHQNAPAHWTRLRLAWPCIGN